MIEIAGGGPAQRGTGMGTSKDCRRDYGSKGR